MKTEKIKKDAFELIKFFCEKYGLNFEYAVCDNPFTVILCSDFFFNFTDIIFCLDHDIESNLLFQWYNDNLENEKQINLQSYHSGLRHHYLDLWFDY